MTGRHPVASTPSTVSHAAAEATAADHALSQLGRARERPRPALVLAEVLAAGFEAITHGLLATAAAIEDSGADTADAIDDARPRLRRRLWHHRRRPA